VGLGEAGRPVIFGFRAGTRGSHPGVRHWGLRGGQGKGAALVVEGDASGAGRAARLVAGGFAPLSWSGDGVRAVQQKAEQHKDGQRPRGGERGTAPTDRAAPCVSGSKREGRGWSWAGACELGQARLAGQAVRTGWVT
jgi:hypothetical protein